MAAAYIVEISDRDGNLLSSVEVGAHGKRNFEDVIAAARECAGRNSAGLAAHARHYLVRSQDEPAAS